MTPFRKPMLACSLLPSGVEYTDENILAAMKKLRYPVFATLKKDGIRALRLNGTLLSRTLKPIPNESIRQRSLVLPGGFDMELWNPSLTYDEVESIVMSKEHPRSDEIQFHVLDWFGVEMGYWLRYDSVLKWCNDNLQIESLRWEYPSVRNTAQGLLNWFLTVEQTGGEGICFRTHDSPYKQGRSTLNEQYLVKLCRHLRAEATVFGFEEAVEVGRLETPKGTLGALWVRDAGGREFKVGSGFTVAERQRVWDNYEAFVGKQLTYKYKPHNEKENPRSPVFVGWREKGY